MPKYIVSAKTSGTAWAEVEAKNEEEAIKKAQLDGEWVSNDWNLNTEYYSGGYIEAQEIK